MNKNVVVLGNPRSGNTYIFELIHNWLNVYPRNCFGRQPIFDQKHPDLDNKIHEINTWFSNIIRNHHHENQTVVKFHIPWHHVGSYYDFHDVFDKFYKIKMIRTDMLSSALSLTLAMATNNWVRNQNSKNLSHAVYLKPLIFRENVQFLARCVEQILEWPFYDQIIYYHDITGDPVVDQHLIIPFSETPKEHVSVTTIPSQPVMETILNLEELTACFYHEVKKINSRLFYVDSFGKIQHRV